MKNFVYNNLEDDDDDNDDYDDDADYNGGDADRLITLTVTGCPLLRIGEKAMMLSHSLHPIIAIMVVMMMMRRMMMRRMRIRRGEGE